MLHKLRSSRQPPLVLLFRPPPSLSMAVAVDTSEVAAISEVAVISVAVMDTSRRSLWWRPALLAWPWYNYGVGSCWRLAPTAATFGSAS